MAEQIQAGQRSQKCITKRLNRQSLMEMFLNTKYEGLSQLLAVPLPLPRSKEECLASDSTISSEIPTRNRRLGFVPFRGPFKADASELSNLRSTSEEESLSSQCMISDPIQDTQLNFRQPKVKKGPYRKYTLEEKRLAVDMINKGRDLKSVAREFDIPRRNLLRWRKNGCERKEGGGRPTDFEMENRIYAMIRNSTIITEKEIREMAKKMSSLKNFKASKGWFVKFCRRYDLNNLDSSDL